MDINGDGKMAVHTSAGLYHNPHVNANGMDAMARNPPANAEHLLRHARHAAGRRGAGAVALIVPKQHGVERDAKTPESYNYSAGIQRE